MGERTEEIKIGKEIRKIVTLKLYFVRKTVAARHKSYSSPCPQPGKFLRALKTTIM